MCYIGHVGPGGKRAECNPFALRQAGVVWSDPGMLGQVENGVGLIRVDGDQSRMCRTRAGCAGPDPGEMALGPVLMPGS